MIKKTFQEDLGKTSAENLLNLKPAKFYSRSIKKLPVKWLDVIENNDEYSIDWN